MKSQQKWRSFTFTRLLVYLFTCLLFYSFSIEHITLPLLALRSTNWDIGPLDTNVLQINVFYEMPYANYLGHTFFILWFTDFFLTKSKSEEGKK